MILGISLARVDLSHKTGACLATWLIAAAFFSQAAGISYAAESQSPAPPVSRARSYFASAQKALAAGDSVTAVEKLRQAVQADPKFARPISCSDSPSSAWARRQRPSNTTSAPWNCSRGLFQAATTSP